VWLFTGYGFYLIACAGQPNGPIDPGTVMIRARCAGHLRSVQRRFPALGETMPETQNGLPLVNK
jgi:hypothetical protein